MEHITVSELTDHAAIAIPYLCSKPWDNSPFLTYMVREGWSEAQLIGQDAHCKRSETEILDFLQTWLFFGLLRESCGPKGSPGYFVRPLAEGGFAVSTENLRAIWREENKRWAEEPREAYQQWQLHLLRCLDAAHSVLTRLAIEEMPFLSSPVIFSIASFCDFVKTTVLGTELRSRCSNLASGLFKALEDRMAAVGWCPTNIRRFSTCLDVASLVLVATLPPPDPEKSHPDCDSHECKAYQIKEESYLRGHDPSCGGKNCRDLKLPPDRLHAILSGGSIILTKYSEDGASEPDLEAFGARPDSHYIAISHVWSDGFGNPKENALFSCQAQRIARYARDASQPSDAADVPFWLDTLSCPVAPDDATDLAISMMRETYADADAVLVLSNHLLCRKKPVWGLEVLAMILATSWTRRLWTLQEGTLAKRLIFQFQDEAIDLDMALSLAYFEMRQFLEPDSIEYVSLLNTAMSLHHLWRGEGAGELTEMRLHSLHSELEWRSTSVPTDEPLCIGALLGIPLKDIIKADVADRKKQLWALIKTPPRGVLFWTGERLREAGFRWAPASLLGDSLSYFSQVNFSTAVLQQKECHLANTQLSKDGLITGADALNLGRWAAGIPNGFFVSDGADKLFWVTRLRGADDKRPLRILAAASSSDGKAIAAQFDRSLSIILRDAAENLAFPNKQGALSALIVSHLQAGGEMIEATIEDICTIFPVHFLTAEQREYVTKTVGECLESLGDMRTTSEVEIAALNPTLPQLFQGAGGEKEYLHVSRDVGGSRRIVYNHAFWWVECVSIVRDQVWCLD